MFRLFESDTADDAWLAAAKAITGGCSLRSQAGRGGDTLELLHAGMAIADPRQRWILSRHPPLNPAFAIAEVVWIIAGRNDAAFVNHWNPVLPRFAGADATYHGAYGHRLRSALGLDQLTAAADALRGNPDGRQVVLQIWDVERDFPDSSGNPRSPDIPCNIISMLKIRGGRLEWMQVLRSNDLHRGTPHNIVQFTTLQEVVAGWVGVELGSYCQLSDSLHVYMHDLDSVRASERIPVPKNGDSLAYPYPSSARWWAELADRMDTLVNESELRLEVWKRVSNWSGAPQSFKNLLCVVAADDARRRGWARAQLAVMEPCSNLALRLAWDRWCNRMRGNG